jgi:hypothetical protein
MRHIVCLEVWRERRVQGKGRGMASPCLANRKDYLLKKKLTLEIVRRELQVAAKRCSVEM